MEDTLLITVPQMIVAVCVAMGVPSAFTAYIFRRYEKREDEKERRKQEFHIHILENINAAIALSEATARAVQRIPDAKCNGDMSAALNYALEVKHRQKDFLRQEAIKQINN